MSNPESSARQTLSLEDIYNKVASIATRKEEEWKKTHEMPKDDTYKANVEWHSKPENRRPDMGPWAAEVAQEVLGKDVKFVREDLNAPLSYYFSVDGQEVKVDGVTFWVAQNLIRKAQEIQ